MSDNDNRLGCLVTTAVVALLCLTFYVVLLILVSAGR